MYAVALNNTVVDILKVGVSGFCFLLAFLGYQLLKEQQRKTEPDPAMLSAIKFFLMIAVVLSGLVAVHSVASVIWARDEREVVRLRAELDEARKANQALTSQSQAANQASSQATLAATAEWRGERDKLATKLARLAEAIDAKYETERANLAGMLPNDPNKQYAELVLKRIDRMRSILDER